MHSKYGKTFRDQNELNQATSFLHENGILLHYEDATLKDLFFLDSQWLADLLAHVVTIREINPYAKNGTMRTDDLKQLFKSTSYSFNVKSYILNLLNKFEVALTWDSRTILIPSLLPEEPSMNYNGSSSSAQQQDEVRIPLRSRNRTMNSNFFNQKKILIGQRRSAAADSNDFEDLSSASELNSFKISSLHKPENRIYRLFLMRYFPSGFFSRLIVKLLADDIYSNVMKDYFNFPDELLQNHQEFSQFLANKLPYWKCYQTGLSLVYLDQEIFKVKEVLNSVSGIARPDEFDYLQDVKFYLQQEKNWIDISIQKSSILEIYLPNQQLLIELMDKNNEPKSSFIIEPNLISVTKLLSMTVDHVDLLMEDWYPSLGTRFLHTSDGKFLISRIACCKDCMHSNYNQDTNKPISSTLSVANNKIIQTQPKKSSIDGIYERSVVFDSRTQQLSDQSDLKDLNGFKLNKIDDSFKILKSKTSMIVYCFMIEECILKASENKSVHCPVHKKLNLKQIAPDVMFCDLTSKLVFNPESIKRTKLLGRGSFGLVFKATVEQQPTLKSDIKSVKKIVGTTTTTTTANLEVAMKSKQINEIFKNLKLIFSLFFFCIF